MTDSPGQGPRLPSLKLYEDMNNALSQDNIGIPWTSERETTPKDRWYREAGVKFYPLSFGDMAENFSALVERNLLADMAPIPKLFNSKSILLTFGSCFADNIRKYMAALRRSTGTIHVSEGLNNTFAILSYVRWALTGDDPSMGQWFIKTPEGKIRHYFEDSLQDQVAIYSEMMSAHGFIFTFGMTEIWRDSETGGVFWRGIPQVVFQAGRHKFENSSFEENRDNLLELYHLIRQHRPDVPIIFTVSPVTLSATFRNDAAVISDCISKSTLRTAVDSVMRRNLPGLYYWPSFEIVRWFGAHIETSTFTQFSAGPDGKMRTDSSHVKDWVIEAVVKKFVEHTFT
ncbi:MAG: GSCFA domain-containing protein [Rhodospirillaceae bacterium]|nr:GSCFA domain-containing protein [Rhodospirillaceae bacterium]